MPPSDSKAFLRELDKKLWTATDRPATAALKERGRPAYSYNITSTCKLIDDALEAIGKENLKLKGVLDRRYTPLQIDPANRAERVRLPAKAARRGRAAARINLSSLIDLIDSIPFRHADLHAKDILGHEHPINHPSSSSAILGDLCVFAVQNSSMAIRGTDFNFGKESANSFTQDQHPDLRADYLMANPRKFQEAPSIS